MALLNLVWVGSVRVDAGEVELTGNEEQYGTHGGEAGVAVGFAFGGLEEAAEGLDEAVGLTGLGPGNNAVEVSADHAGDILHWLDLRAQDIGAPLRRASPALDRDHTTLSSDPHPLRFQKRP